MDHQRWVCFSLCRLIAGIEESENERNKFEAALLARSIDPAINELGWKTLVRAKFMEMQAMRLLALELASAQGNWEVSSKIEENHVGHDAKKAALIQPAYRQHELANQLALPPCETNSGASAKHQ